MFEEWWRSGRKCSFSCGCITVHTNEQPWVWLNVCIFCIFIWIFDSISDQMSDHIWPCAHPHTLFNSYHISRISNLKYAFRALVTIWLQVSKWCKCHYLIQQEPLTRESIIRTTRNRSQRSRRLHRCCHHCWHLPGCQPNYPYNYLFLLCHQCHSYQHHNFVYSIQLIYWLWTTFRTKRRLDLALRKRCWIWEICEKFDKTVRNWAKLCFW